MEELTLEIKELLEANGFGDIVAINIVDKHNIKITYLGEEIEQD